MDRIFDLLLTLICAAGFIVILGTSKIPGIY